MLYQADAATLTAFSKEDKNLYECKVCNTPQLITEFPDKDQHYGEVEVSSEQSTC